MYISIVTRRYTYMDTVFKDFHAYFQDSVRSFVHANFKTI